VLYNVPCHELRESKAMYLYQHEVPLPIILGLFGQEQASTAVDSTIPAIDVSSESRLGGRKLQTQYSLR
jgi:hypothetical protein